VQSVVITMYRPRGSLTRTVFEKIQKDKQLDEMDKRKWYSIDDEMIKSLSPEVWRKFQPSQLDHGTQLFLQNCRETSDSLCWQIWLSVATSILSWFINQTSINGLLGRGSMHVFSTTQFEELIDWKDGPLLTSLLDIGAGDGFTTELMRKFFTQVYVTEMSKPMKWALSEKGFTVLNETSLNETNQRFSVISCLNVLDRCDQPLQMLNQIKRLVQVGGIAVVAFVIPYKPYVEFQSETHAPSERLPINGPNFEAEIVNFVTKVLEPNGWELVKWTRLPYLCQGDIHQAYYWLDDAVFVIRPKEQN